MQPLTLARRVGNTVRFAELVQVLVKHGFRGLVYELGLHNGLPARVLRALKLRKAQEERPETRGKRLNAALTELGPSFVKLGQVLSTRADILSKEIRADLGKLQDDVAAVPFGEMRRVIEGSLGAPIDELFEGFNPAPLASASLSQVYRARLANGDEVAVKIRRPRVEQMVQADIKLLADIAKWFDENVDDFEWLNFSGLVNEFRRTIERELDFGIEARTIQRFYENFEDDPSVEIPRVYANLSSEEVMTMSYIDGIRLDDVARFKERNCDPKEIALLGCHAVCKQIFEHNLFHADPHPGNILVTRDNRIAFLDFGMVGRFSHADIEILTKLLQAVFQENAKMVTDCMLLLTDGDELKDERALQQEVADYVSFEAQAVIARGEVGKALEKILDVLSRHGLVLPPRFALLIKALATIESTGHKLDPKLDMLPIMKPYIEEVFHRRFSREELATEAQEYFYTLLTLFKTVPDDLRVLLKNAKRGQFKIQFRHLGLERSTRVLDRASNRIAYSVVTGSLIVGSSLLIASGADVAGARALGLAGFIMAGITGVAILISIIRSRNF